MKFSNFGCVEVQGNSPIDWRFYATITVTKGWGPWKRVVDERITKKYAAHWLFCDTGKYVSDAILPLVRKWQAKNPTHVLSK